MVALPILTALLLLVSVTEAPAATHCVNPGGTGGCFSTVQAAVDAATDGDVVSIEAGTYAGRVSIPAQRVLTVQGAGPEATILDMSAVDEFSSFFALGRSRVVLQDFAIVDSISDSALHVFSKEATLLRVRVSGSQFDGVRFENAGDRLSKATVLDSTFEGSGWSGIWVNDTRLTIRGSTMLGNDEGVLAASRGKIEIQSSTLSGNEVGAQAGRDLATGTPGIIKIENSTITNNLEGVRTGRGKVTLIATIIAGNTIADCIQGNSFDRVASRGFNVVGDAGDCTFLGRNRHDIIGVDPLLGPLQDNGGPTLTHALLPGSPAIDAVTSARWCRTPDQLGTPRPFPCDSGAVEVP